MKRLEIRPVKTEDAESLSAIHQAAFAQGWDSAAMVSLLRNRAKGWLASYKDRPAGFVLLRQAGAEAEILTLAVAPAARRRGIGAALLDMACASLKKDGVAKLFLEVSESNEAAIGLYEHTDFARFGERPRYYEDGAAALLYARYLV